MLERIKNDISVAMKNAASDTVETLRYVMSEAQLIALKDKRKELNDDDLQSSISKCLKEGNEGIDIYKNLVGKVAEDNYLRNYRLAEICKRYLPTQLTEEYIILQIKNIISEVNAVSVKDMGKVMGALMPKVKGRADGRIVNQAVQQLLV